MFCPNCGKEKVDNQDTCLYCGKNASNNVDNENPYIQERAIYQDSTSQNRYAYNNVPNKQVSKYLSQGNLIVAGDSSQKAKIWNIVGASIYRDIIGFGIIIALMSTLIASSVLSSLFFVL